MAPDPTDGRQTLVTAFVVVASILGLLSVAVFLPLVPGAGLIEGGIGGETESGAEPTPITPQQEGGSGTPEERTTQDGGKSGSGGVGGSDEVGVVTRNAPINVITYGPVVPGTEVTVQVLKGDVPVGGVTVYVAGDAVGRTNQFGRIRVQVPFKESFRVRVQRPANRTDTRNAAETAIGVPTESSTRRYALAQPTQDLLAVTRPANENTTVSTNVTTETDANITFQQTPRLGQRVQLTVQVGTTPITDAVVRVNGDTVGQTGPHGSLVVTIPLAKNVTVTAERGPISTTRTLRFDGLTVGVEPRILPFLVAGQGAVISVTQGGKPIPNAPIYLGGERIGTTDKWGQTTAELPVAGGVTVRATSDEFTVVRRVGGLFDPVRNALFGLGVFLGVGVVIRRRHGSFRSALGWLLEGGRSSLVVILVGLATTVNTLLDRLLEVLDEFRDADRTALGDRLRETLSRLHRWVLSFLHKIRAYGATLTTLLTAKISRTAQTATDATDDAETTATSSTSVDYLSIRDAWETAVEPLSPTQFRSKTPAEIGALLVYRGDPPEPVWTIVDAFRDVEYGARSPDDYVAAVERAAATLERERPHDSDSNMNSDSDSDSEDVETVTSTDNGEMGG